MLLSSVGINIGSELGVAVTNFGISTNSLIHVPGLVGTTDPGSYTVGRLQFTSAQPIDRCVGPYARFMQLCHLFPPSNRIVTEKWGVGETHDYKQYEFRDAGGNEGIDIEVEMDGLSDFDQKHVEAWLYFEAQDPFIAIHQIGHVSIELEEGQFIADKKGDAIGGIAIVAGSDFFSRGATLAGSSSQSSLWQGFSRTRGLGSLGEWLRSTMAADTGDQGLFADSGYGFTPTGPFMLEQPTLSVEFMPAGKDIDALNLSRRHGSDTLPFGAIQIVQSRMLPGDQPIPQTIVDLIEAAAKMYPTFPISNR